jgi:hypothetical protein
MRVFLTGEKENEDASKPMHPHFISSYDIRVFTFPRMGISPYGVRGISSEQQSCLTVDVFNAYDNDRRLQLPLS